MTGYRSVSTLVWHLQDGEYSEKISQGITVYLLSMCPFAPFHHAESTLLTLQQRCPSYRLEYIQTLTENSKLINIGLIPIFIFLAKHFP